MKNSRLHWFVLAALVFSVGGCKWFKSPGKDNVEPPSELTEYAPTIDVRRAWSRDLGEGGSRAGLRLKPAFADGRVYASDHDGNVFAIDAGSGDVAWRAETEAKIGSGPGVGEGLVAVGSIDGAVLAFDAGTGEARWQATVSSEVLAAPAIGAGVVVVRSQDGRVYGLDVADGKRRWVFDRGIPLLTIRGNGAPVIQDANVYVGYDNGKIVALKLVDGTLLWEQTVGQSEGRSELERMIDVDGELALSGSELYAVTYRGQVGALATDSGRVVWSRAGSAYGGLAFAGDRLYVSSSDGAVSALDVRNGSSLWKQEALAHRWLTTPAVVGEYVVVGDFEGWVHWINAETGDLAARVRVGGDGIRATPVVSGGTVYVADADGSIAALRVGG